MGTFMSQRQGCQVHGFTVKLGCFYTLAAGYFDVRMLKQTLSLPHTTERYFVRKKNRNLLHMSPPNANFPLKRNVEECSSCFPPYTVKG